MKNNDILKFENNRYKESQKKPENCYACNQKKPIINSHTYPKSKTTDEIIFKLMPSIFDEQKSKVTKAAYNDRFHRKKFGIFYFLCSECDKKLFYNYENEDLTFSNIQLNEIALKSEFSKLRLHNYLIKDAIRGNLETDSSGYLTDDCFVKLLPYFGNIITNKDDIKQTENNISKLLSKKINMTILHERHIPNFELYINASFTPYFNPKGVSIVRPNKIYPSMKDYKYSEIPYIYVYTHIVNNGTKIVLFTRTKYRHFNLNLEKLSDEQLISFINCYTEDIYLSEKSIKRISKNSSIRKSVKYDCFTSKDSSDASIKIEHKNKGLELKKILE